MSASLLVIGAHPDDPDIRAGGLACAAADAGHDVRFVSVTDGRAGHHERHGEELVQRRREEATAAAEVAGIDYEILDIPDGRLRPTVENRERIIRTIRECEPDVVITHRPNDYHPDHRYTAQLVRDAAYMVTVPHVCPDVAPLDTNPVFASLFDAFERPDKFEPDVIVPIEEEYVERKYDMLDCHESQLYEWLPYTEGILDRVPDDPAARRSWLETDPLSALAEMHTVTEQFETERTGGKPYTEAFEISEYGRELDSALSEELFTY